VFTYVYSRYALCLLLQILLVAALDIKTHDVPTVSSINSLLSQYCKASHFFCKFLCIGGGGGLFALPRLSHGPRPALAAAIFQKPGVHLRSLQRVDSTGHPVSRSDWMASFSYSRYEYRERIARIWHLYCLDGRNALIYASTISRTFPICHMSLGKLTVAMPKAGDRLWLLEPYMYVCTSMYVCMYVCMYACMHVCIFLIKSLLYSMFHYKEAILHARYCCMSCDRKITIYMNVCMYMCVYVCMFH
jgi:hypothetical protein